MSTPDPPLVELDPGRRHRVVAERFAEVARRVEDWEVPTPVDGWVARDVVRHLVDWSTAFFAAGGVRLRIAPNGDRSPLVAWEAHAAAVQSMLDDRESAASEFSHPQAGTHRFADAVDRFYTADVFMHTWDLARSIDVDPALDPAWCEVMLAGMEPMDDVLRSSGHYGPRRAVAADSDPEARLIAFIGRDPDWRATRE